MSQVHDNFENDVVTIAYHMGWPGASDPWYQANPDENYARRFYYGVNAIPWVFIDGSHAGSASYNNLANQVLNRSQQTSPLLLTLDAIFDGDNIVVTVQTEAEEAWMATLHVALTETYSHWTSPAPNGMTEFHYPMLSMNNEAAGELISVSPTQPSEVVVEFPYDQEWDVTNITVVAFVQASNEDILQAENVTIDATIPMLLFDDYSIDDAGQWRENNRPDAGETVDMAISLRGMPQFQPAENITGTLSCEDDRIVVSDNNGSWPDIGPGEQADNDSDPFAFTVPENFEPEYIPFTLDLTADGGYSRTIEFDALLGVPEVLLVLDHGEPHGFPEIWERIFEDLGVIPDVTTDPLGDNTDLTMYPEVVWATVSDDDLSNVLTTAEQSLISTYLAEGGNLLLTSQYAGEAVDAAWLMENFGCTHDLDAITTPPAYGLNGSESADFAGETYYMVGPGGAANNNSPSTMNLEGSEALFTYMDVDDVAVVGYSGAGFRSIYCGFPIESITGASGTPTADIFLGEMLEWLSFESPSSDMMIPIAGNRFELVSMHVFPGNLSPENVFASLSDLVIVKDDMGGFYWPELGINTIGNIQPMEGYKIFSDADGTWLLDGIQHDPNTTYSLQGNQWNYLGYPNNTSQPLLGSIDDLEPVLQIIQNDDGLFYWPGVGQTLTELLPGEGYKTFVTEDISFSFNHMPPPMQRMNDAPLINILPEPANAPTATGSPWIVKVDLDEALLQQGAAAVELYDGTRLAGAGTVDEASGTAFVVAWEAAPEFGLTNGFTAGQPVTARVRTPADDELQIATPTSNLHFADSYAGRISLEASEGMQESFEVGQAFPNPFNPSTSLQVTIPSAGDVQLRVYNLIGQEVYSSVEFLSAGSHALTFDAQSAGGLASGVYLMEVQFAGQRQLQKVALLK